jgi:2,3-bisphosphoglycerate-independent phosphoglycerate mutase
VIKKIPMNIRSRPGLIVILDGFGIAPEGPGNAVSLARTPRWDALLKKYSHTQLHAAGRFVGLPEGVSGNSEVGHLTLGAGRTVDQDLLRIQKQLAAGALEQSPVWKAFVQSTVAKRHRVVHLVGLVSDGFVHSSLDQLHSFLHALKSAGITQVALHAITDGRDSLPTNGRGVLARVQQWLETMELGSIQTVCGRFYAMDRDKRWERTEKAFRLMVYGDAEGVYGNAADHCERAYQNNLNDEFMPPAKSKTYRGMQDGDALFFFNYRADRMRQITQAFLSSEFNYFSRRHMPTFGDSMTLTDYDESVASRTLFPKPKIEETLGSVMASHGAQLRVAETEKYAHVTYFFSGGREEPFQNERRILVPSNRDVRTYDERPEMSAAQIVERSLDALEKDKPRLAVINFANPDMIGHTGNLPATVRAIETVDRCLGRVVDWVEANQAFALITSDHGNAEQMLSASGGPLPCHTAAMVPLVLVDSGGRTASLTSGSIADVAPTFLQLQGIPAPKSMTGRSLLSE